MFPWHSTPLVVVLASFTLFARAAEDMAPPDFSNVILELESIREKQTQARQETIAGAISFFQEAARNGPGASRAFADATRAVEFDGQPNAGSRFADWRKSKSDMLGSRSLQTAAQLHLQYLEVTLKQIGDPDTSARVTESIAYVRNLAAARKTHGDDLARPNEIKDLLEKPLQDGIFARASQLGPRIANMKDWEKTPGNINGILENNVRRVLRKEKDPGLIDSWDLQIEIEAALADTATSPLAGTNFAETRRPQLLWRKANDYAVLGQPVRGLSSMLELIRQYPTHPDIDQWLETATNQVRAQLPAAE